MTKKSHCYFLKFKKCSFKEMAILIWPYFNYAKDNLVINKAFIYECDTRLFAKLLMI